MIYNETSALLEAIEKNSTYIIYNPGGERAVISEIRAMLLLAGKLLEKSYKAIFWIKSGFIAKDELEKILSAEPLLKVEFLWLYAEKIDLDLLPNAQLAFTTAWNDIEIDLPKIKKATFTISSALISSGNENTIQNLHMKTEESQGENFSYHFLSTVFKKATYCFLSSAPDVKQYITNTGYFQGIMSDLQDNTKSYIDIGSLRREIYAVENEDEFNKSVILYLPTTSALETGVDSLRVIKTLSNAFPNHEIWYRPFPPERDSVTCKNILAGCTKIPNVICEGIVASGKLESLYQTGCILVTDYSSAVVSFTLSTGRPGIQLILEKDKFAPLVGCEQVYSYENLVLSVKTALDNYLNLGHRQVEEYSHYFRPSGETINYIVDNIENMLAGRELPESVTVDFAAGDKFNDYKAYKNIFIRIREQLSAGLKQDFTLEQLGSIEDSFAHIIRCVFQKNNILAPADIDVSNFADELISIVLKVDNPHKKKMYKPFNLKSYLIVREEMCPVLADYSECLQYLTNCLNFVLQNIKIPETDIQKDFYNYCKMMIAEYPESSLCKRWFYDYLQSEYVKWMEYDSVFALCYRVYTIRALFWMNKSSDAADLFFKSLGEFGGAVLRPYWFDGKWEVNELETFMGNLINNSSSWNNQIKNKFSQLMLNIIIEQKDQKQLDKILVGLINILSSKY